MLVNRNGRVYRYRKVREGKSVRSVYQGSGDLAVLSEQLHRRDRLEAGLRRVADREIDDEDRAARDAYRAVFNLADAILARSGYHRHARGAWRRKRGTPMATELATMTADESRSLGKFDEWAGQLLQKALLDQDPKEMKRASDRLAVAFRGDPAGFMELVRFSTFDLTTNVIVSHRTPEFSPLVREAYSKEVQLLREQLEGDNPSPIVRVLAEAVALARLDLMLVMIPRENDGSDALDRRRTRAHDRYLRAIRTLAAVRRSERPVQVVVAGTGPQQVNIKG